MTCTVYSKTLAKFSIPSPSLCYYTPQIQWHGKRTLNLREICGADLTLALWSFGNSWYWCWSVCTRNLADLNPILIPQWCYVAFCLNRSLFNFVMATHLARQTYIPLCAPWCHLLKIFITEMILVVIQHIDWFDNFVLALYDIQNSWDDTMLPHN